MMFAKWETRRVLQICTKLSLYRIVAYEQAINQANGVAFKLQLSFPARDMFHSWHVAIDIHLWCGNTMQLIFEKVHQFFVHNKVSDNACHNIVGHICFIVVTHFPICATESTTDSLILCSMHRFKLCFFVVME